MYLNALIISILQKLKFKKILQKTQLVVPMLYQNSLSLFYTII